MRKAAPLTGILDSSRAFVYGNILARRDAALGASDETKSAVRMGRLSFIAFGSQRDAHRRIKIQIKLERTRRTEPEKLCVRALPLERVKITFVKKLELSATDPINAALNDETPLKFRREVP
jgi:hypothetical protein